MKVLKFGGSSVGSSTRIKNVAELIQSRKGQIVVLSAMSGTTNDLVNIAKKRNNADVQALLKQYHKTVYELLSDPVLLEKGVQFINEQFSNLETLINNDGSESEIVAKGEIISTQLLSFYMKEMNVEHQLLDSTELMKLTSEGEPDSAYIREIAKEKINPTVVNIIQGFICRDAEGKISNLKRGGSDYTASLIGVAVNASSIEIWTDIDGFHNNDPRYVSNTSSITHLSYDEAAELAYFGAKILHPSTLIPAKKAGIPVWLKNTMEPDKIGTIISNETINNQIKAIAGKDGVTAIKIKSDRMLLAYGFLSKVFQIFEEHRTPIDMIATSEIAVSLTIDDNHSITEIIDELKELGEVEVDYNQTIICVVGNMISDNKGVVSKVFSSLLEVPVRMISYGGSRHNISFLVSEENKNKILNLLHQNIFNEEHETNTIK